MRHVRRDYLSKPLRPQDVDRVLTTWVGSEPGAADPPVHSDAIEGLLDEARMATFSCQNIGAAFMATLAASVEQGEDTGKAVAELEAAFEPTRTALHDALARPR